MNKTSPLKSHLKHFKIDRTYKCEKCDKFFISKYFLEKHVETTHPIFVDIDPFEISSTSTIQTPVNISNFDNLRKQNKDNATTNTLDTFYNIEDLNCAITYSDGENDDVLEPMMNAVSETVMMSNNKEAPKSKRKQCMEKSECKQCSEFFLGKNAKSRLRYHIKSQHNRFFTCDLCNSSFTSRHSLKGHITAVHDLIKKVCPECHKPVNDLTRHVRLQHKKTQKRDFNCDICKQSFRTLYSLQRHKEVIHFKVKNWPCDLCEKVFGEKRDMVRHKTAVHFGIKNQVKVWKCPECDISLKLRREYDEHKRTFHPNLTNEQVIRFLNSELETKAASNVAKFSRNILKI